MAKQVTRVVGMSPLRALITERMREKGWDAPTVEGRGVKHATLHRYMNPLVLRQLPRASVLEALAGALELDVEDVRQAAKDSIGDVEPRAWRRWLELSGPGPHDMSIVISRRDRLPMTHEEFIRALKEVERRLGTGYAEAWEAALLEEGLIDDPAIAQAVEASTAHSDDYAIAARTGIALQAQIDAAAADPNVDPPAGDDPA